MDSKTLRRLAAIGLTGDQFRGVLQILADLEEQGEELLAKESVRLAKESKRTRLYRTRGGGKIPADLKAAVFIRDEFTCIYCGSGEQLECDHKVPVSKGGATILENLVTACKPCNASKRDRIHPMHLKVVDG